MVDWLPGGFLEGLAELWHGLKVGLGKLSLHLIPGKEIHDELGEGLLVLIVKLL